MKYLFEARGISDDNCRQFKVYAVEGAKLTSSRDNATRFNTVGEANMASKASLDKYQSVTKCVVSIKILKENKYEIRSL